MATYPNGTLDTVRRSITYRGDKTWATAPTWENYTTWSQYSGSGEPLVYQTAIIDLGSSKSVYPQVSYSGDGTIQTVIEYSPSSADLSSATTRLGEYTNDNTASGTAQTFTVLDYADIDYTTSGTDYTAFTARYVQFTVFVEKFRDGARQVPQLTLFNWQLLEDTITENIDAEAVTGETHTLSFTNIGVARNIQMTAHSEANKKLVPQIVSLSNNQVRVVDANTFSTAAVDATVDIQASGLPKNFRTSSTGITPETA